MRAANVAFPWEFGTLDPMISTIEFDAGTQHAINGLRAFGYSWGDTTSRRGVTRQVSRKQWGLATSRVREVATWTTLLAPS
jgi:hypothetical protein